MMSKVDIKEQLLQEAKEKAEKSVELKINAVKQQLEQDLTKMEYLLELISTKVLYKTVKNKGYVLVTKEILYEDFNKDDVRYGSKGIKFEGESEWNKSNLYVKVNGEYYYHIGLLIQRYEKDIKSVIKQSYYDIDKSNEKLKQLEELKQQQPQIIKMFEEFKNNIGDENK